MSTEIKWVTLDNMTGESTLRQHAFKDKKRKKPYTLEEYTGNVSLCGRVVVGSEEDESIEEWSKITTELISVDCCKSCEKIYKRTTK